MIDNGEGMVISLEFSRDARKNTKRKDESDLQCIMASNRSNQERMRRERKKANKSVLKTYRIKKKN